MKERPCPSAMDTHFNKKNMNMCCICEFESIERDTGRVGEDSCAFYSGLVHSRCCDMIERNNKRFSSNIFSL